MIGFTKTTQSINIIVGNGKRFMAYEIIKRLEQEKETTLLSRLAENIEISGKENNKLHNIWELSFDWKHCESEKFINQKLDYYHINPVKGVWNLCESPVNYKHSSAQFCMENSHGVYVLQTMRMCCRQDYGSVHNVLAKHKAGERRCDEGRGE